MTAPSLPPIGWLRHNFLPSSETFIHSALTAVTDRGAKVRVFGVHRSSEEKFPYDDVTTLQTGGPMGWLETAQYWTTSQSPKQRRWADSVGLIHAHMGYTGAHALRAAARRRIPLITSFYGRDVTLAGSASRFAPQYAPYALLRKRLFARGDRFLVLSNHMKDALVAQGCPAEKIHINRIGIDPERFAPRPEDAASKSSVTLLMVGREVEKKGFDDGLTACAQAKAQLDSDPNGPSLRVVLLGTGAALAPELRAQADRLRLDVEWPDPKTRVPVAMAEADILMVPSRTAQNGDQEGTPTVICEGSAAQLPVIGTRHAGIPDQIDHEKTGLLCDERDTDALAAAIVRLAKDGQMRAAYGQAGREKIVAGFSVAAHAETLLHHYRQLTSA